MRAKIIFWIVILSFLSSCVLPGISTPSATPTTAPEPSATSQPCLASGDQSAINARLHSEGDKAILCQGAVFNLTGPVVVNANKQEIYTEGFPKDDSRATLRIVSSVTTAVVMRDYSDVVLSNLIIDGNRPNLGYQSGDALIYAGGNSSGQIFRALKIYEPRSWSALHLIEPCENALIEDNDIGPSGSPGGNWADGISFACTNSIVRNNRIVDATDGGIVIFGAAGSLIEGNTIQAETRTLLGGINMVDFDPYNGNYTGTVVQNNVIEANGAVIRIGLGMGPRVWICLPVPSGKGTIFGATVTKNTLRGSKMQYGFAVDGVTNWTVTDNIDDSTHIGIPSVDCNGRIASKPAGFLYDASHSQGVFQPEFVQANLDLALWAIRNPVPSGN